MVEPHAAQPSVLCHQLNLCISCQLLCFWIIISQHFSNMCKYKINCIKQTLDLFVLPSWIKLLRVFSNCVQLIPSGLAPDIVCSQVAKRAVTSESDSISVVTAGLQEVSRPGRAGGGISGAVSSFPESLVIPNKSRLFIATFIRRPRRSALTGCCPTHKVKTCPQVTSRTDRDSQ